MGPCFQIANFSASFPFDFEFQAETGTGAALRDGLTVGHGSHQRTFLFKL
jgi:hypothetical protein